MINSSEIKNYFDYNPEGFLVWKKKPCNRIKLGDRAGVLNKHIGYVVIRLKGKLYYEHQLIWCFHHNIIPNCQIDHINRIRNDNRIENLRLALNNQKDQLQNTNLSKNNSSGYKGIYWDNNRNKWQVYINSENKRINLGRFDDLNEAIQVREDAENQYWNFIK